MYHIYDSSMHVKYIPIFRIIDRIYSITMKTVSKLMRFFPIAYHTLERNKCVQIIILSYNEAGERIAIRFNYNYWFYASLQSHPHDAIVSSVSKVVGVEIDDAKHAKVLRSTRDLHTAIPVIKVRADNSEAKNKAIRALRNSRIAVHEEDDILTPVIKLMAEYRFVRYTWLECDVEQPANTITTCSSEYMGITSTIRTSPTQTAPPDFSIFSFDIETDTTNENKMPDALTSPHNCIRVLAVTYKSSTDYQEHVLVFGPDTSNVYKKYIPNDTYTTYMDGICTSTGQGDGVKVYIHTYTKELDMINKFFSLINETDPDIITGHNIIGFDIPYIDNRYTLLGGIAATNGINSKVGIPNISRLINHRCGKKEVEWSNMQVAMSGYYYDTSGRIWIDTLILSGRGLLGQLPNRKLDTLAKEILGMSKNDVSYKDMFHYFRLYSNYMASLKPNCPYSTESVIARINDTYGYAIKKHNKKHLPVRKETNINVDVLNNVISVINALQQRDTKIPTISMKESLKINRVDVYNKYRIQCNALIDKWNIPVEVNLPPLDKLNVLWYLVNLYCMQDTRIPLQVIENRKIVSVLREQTSVFSVDVNDVLMRGQVFTVTNSQYRYCNNAGFMMDFGDKGGPAGVFEYEGGYVGKGEPGLKIKDDDSIIFSIDFASLYPTIIIAHNLCYTTWVPLYMRMPYVADNVPNPDYIYTRYASYINRRIEEILLQLGTQSTPDPKLSKQLAELRAIRDVPYEERGTMMCNTHSIPNIHTGKTNTHWFVKECILPGVVSTMLWEQFCNRKAIKRKMDDAYKTKDMAMVTTYNSQQLATKVSMNSTYGGFGTANNRLANFAVAETVTYIGRTAIHTCNSTVEKKGWGSVDYNDTDSAFIRLDNLTTRFDRDMGKIKEYAYWVSKELSTLFPPPMSLETENFFVGFFLKAPKLYAGIKYDGSSLDVSSYTQEYVNTMGLLYIKGLAPVRRDKYQYNKLLFKNLLHGVLTRTDPGTLIYMLEDAITTIWSLKDGFTNTTRIDELFSYNMGITITSLNGSSAAMGQWVGIYETKYGAKPTAGERFNLLVTEVGGIYADKHTKAAPKLVTMEWLLEEGRKLDVVHYLEALAADGNVIEILNIAYPDEVHRQCMKKWYLPQLRKYGKLE